MARVVVAMSGGVDSSVAACLLHEAGHELVGLFMRHGQAEAAACAATGHHGCCTAADAADARRVAGLLKIPFYALNFAEEFGRIVDYFVAEYASGRTPNPCIACNNWLKFGRLFDYADSIGAQYVATGHYARVVVEEGENALRRGADPAKDQSYVLFGIAREALGRLMFPVGAYSKVEIRRMASARGLRLADKPDSQEICFVPDRDHARFVRARRAAGDASGEIVTTGGEVVGHHEGLEQFTVGQRRGLGIALGRRRYVVSIDRATRRVVIGGKEDLARGELTAAGANWLLDPPAEPFPAEVKIRYRTPSVPASVETLPGDRFRVRFAEPCLGVAPGQAVVCYQGDRVMGGGWIE